MNNPDQPPEPTWLPPPDPPTCLVRAYSSNPLQKGGTLIAEDVLDRDTHRRRLCDPDGYRLATCLHCGGDVLHVHDYVERVAFGEQHREFVVRYRCMLCGATWRVLPAFLARHLWYAWPTVEASTMPASSPAAPPATTTPPPRCPVPRTVTRWLERLAASARILVQLFASVGTLALAAMTTPLGLDAARHQLVVAYDLTMGIGQGRRVSALAGHVHRLAPGLRLM